MTIMTDGPYNAEPIEMDPRDHRPGQLHAIAVMAELATRSDLPMAKWEVEPSPDIPRGAYEFNAFPTLDGHLWGLADAGLGKRDAITMWASAFDCEVEEEPHGGSIHAHARFTVRDVPVDIVVVYDAPAVLDDGE